MAQYAEGHQGPRTGVAMSVEGVMTAIAGGFIDDIPHVSYRRTIWHEGINVVGSLRGGEAVCGQITLGLHTDAMRGRGVKSSWSLGVESVVVGSAGRVDQRIRSARVRARLGLCGITVGGRVGSGSGVRHILRLAVGDVGCDEGQSFAPSRLNAVHIEPLLQAAEKHEFAVVTSGPMRGHFPDDHRLSASLAPEALMSADLVVFIGQYCMPSPGEYRFNPDVKTIRVHPVQEDLGRNWPLDLGIVSDEKVFLESLANELPSKKRDAWVNELAAARKKFEDTNLAHYQLGLKHSAATDHIHPAVMAKEVHDFLYKGDIDPKQTVTGIGGWTTGIFSGRWMRANRPGQGLACGYQYGAIGPDLAMVIGAGAAVQRGIGPQAPYKGAPVLCITSDAGIAYSMFELDTAAKYKIPVIAVVYNNNCWGMFPAAIGSARSMHLYLFQENLRYDKMAEGLGARGEYVRTPEQLRAALKRSYDAASKETVSSLDR